MMSVLHVSFDIARGTFDSESSNTFLANTFFSMNQDVVSIVLTIQKSCFTMTSTSNYCGKKT